MRAFYVHRSLLTLYVASTARNCCSTSSMFGARVQPDGGRGSLSCYLSVLIASCLCVSPKQPSIGPCQYHCDTIAALPSTAGGERGREADKENEGWLRYAGAVPPLSPLPTFLIPFCYIPGSCTSYTDSLPPSTTVTDGRASQPRIYYCTVQSGSPTPYLAPICAPLLLISSDVKPS